MYLLLLVLTQIQAHTFMQQIRVQKPTSSPVHISKPRFLDAGIHGENAQKHLQNAASKHLNALSLKVHTDIDECRYLWTRFVGQSQDIFDSWDFRMAWNDGNGLTPSFYVLYRAAAPVALAPISWIAGKQPRYEWFGTYWMEAGTIWTKTDDPSLIEYILKVLPHPIHLNACDPLVACIAQTMPEYHVEHDDPKNTKEIVAYMTMEQLLASYTKKHRYNLRSDYRRISSLSPKAVVTHGYNEHDMNLLIAMNIEQFAHQREDDQSDLVDESRARTYHLIGQYARQEYDIKFIKIYVGDELAAIDLVATTQTRYYMVKGGIQKRYFEMGMSNYLVYWEFEDAIRGGYQLVDALQLDYNWKHRYFDQQQTYVVESVGLLHKSHD